MFQTGPFLTVLASGADPSGTNFVNLIGNGRADIVSGTNVIPASRSISQWINPASFAIPANNIGRFRRFAGGICGGTRDAGGLTLTLSYFQYLGARQTPRGYGCVERF